MPIRMTDDPGNSGADAGKEGGGRSLPGGGSGAGAVAALLLGLFRGKGILLLLLLGAGGFFLSRQGGCSLEQLVQQFSASGYLFDAREFEKASVYEGLEEDDQKNPLPEAVSLLRFAPDRLNQGRQGSCVAWSCAYAAQTILVAAATGADPNSIRFSPSYLYNQIRLEDCQGSYLQRAMDIMSRNGGIPMRAYPYNEQDCERLPSLADLQAGRENRIHGYTRLTEGDRLGRISVRAVKEHLARNAPVAIGMMVGESFMQDMNGMELWTPGGLDAGETGMGGHAMTVIGYDDQKFGGAFQLMNSWGSEWGQNGIAWVRYGDFSTYVKEAYGIDPYPQRTEVANLPLECEIGLVRNDTKAYIPLRLVNGNLFTSVSAVSPGTRFKMEIRNATECYLYIFGQETDGSSYVLFPYLKEGETRSKHSPYCGITGYRLFPRNQSLETDPAGDRDYMAVVVSRDKLDYAELNRLIQAAAGNSYEEKVNNALGSLLVRSAAYRAGQGGTVYFKAAANHQQAAAAIIALNKKQ